MHTERDCMTNLDQTTDSYAARVREMSLTLWKMWHEALQLEESEEPLSPHLRYSVSFAAVTC